MRRELFAGILATSFLLATPVAFCQQVPNAAPGFRAEGVIRIEHEHGRLQ